MDVITHYDNLIYESNDPFRDAPELQKYMDKWDGQPFIDSMELDCTKSVLEIGIGTGRIAAKVAPYCKSLTGIDISPKTINRASENLSDIKNIELVCADFSVHEFKEKFDVIYSSLTFMHFSDKRQLIFKVESLLASGGIFCLSIDKNQSEYIDMGTRKLRIYPDTREYTAKLIQESGMVIVDIYELEFAHIFVCKKS